MVRSLIASLSIAAVLAAALPYTAYAGGQAAPSQATGKTEAAKAKQAVTKGAKAKAPDAKPQAPAQPAPPAAAVPQPAPTDAKPDADKPAETKAPPHFASLRAEKVFLRSGPSSDFPVQWVYERRGLPVEVLASFDIWRKVRDIDGTEGWVHQQMLTGRRSVLVTGAVRDLRRDPDPTSAVVAQLEPGVVAALSHCNPDWCELKAGGYKGWMKRAEVWGLEPDEVIP